MPLNDQEYLSWLNGVQASLPPEPSEAARMKRIEAEMRAPAVALQAGANAQPNGQYSGMIGARGGPLSATGVVTPGSVMGRVGAGPVSYQQVRAGSGQKPIQSVEVGGKPFDPDTYFGVKAQQSPGGMDYSANVGRGGFNASASYNPSQRNFNVNGQYEAKFAVGGNVDTHIGPHKDSKKVFVVNQRHGDGHQHKVMMGYNDRSHALNDYTSSHGPDGVHSIVEMHAHQLPGWLHKAAGGRVHMEGGGPAEREEPRPLTIFAKGPKNVPEGERDQYAGVPEPEAYSRKFASTLRSIPQGVIDYFNDKAAQPDPSQRIAEDVEPFVRGIANIPSAIGSYFSNKAEQPDPSQRVAEDVQNLGRGLGHMVAENPIGAAIDFTGLGGAVTSVPEIKKLNAEIAQAEAEGDMPKARSLKSQLAMAASAMLPVVGGIAKAGAKGSKLAKEAAEAMKVERGAEDASKVERLAEDAAKVDDATTATAKVEDEAGKLPSDEHNMGVERQERRTVKPSSIKLLPGEKEVVNSFEDPIKQGMIASSIRNTKSRFPVSDGWAPIEAIGAEFDDKGNVVVKWQEQTYGYNKGKVTTTKPVLDESAPPRQKIDKDGNAVFDKDGNAVMANPPAKKQPKLDAEGNPVLDADGNPVYTNKNVTQEITDVRALRPDSPQYGQLVKKAVKNSARDILDVVRRANEGDEAALVILRQLGWYREFMKKGFDERGGAYPAFSDLLGATSPNTAVDQNYRYSVDAQKRFARGDFDPQVEAARDYKKSGASLADFPEDQLIRRSNAFDEKTGNFKQYGMNSRNAQMAMADEWRGKEVGQAPKARNFSGNLGGATDEATIDVWAARFLNRMVGNKRLPPAAESGVKGQLGADLKPGGEFGFGQDVFRKLADELSNSKELKPYLNSLGYNDVTPMDLQALTWFIEKENWTKNNWTSKAGEGGSFEDELRKYPSQRWQAGVSIQKDAPPTDEAMAVTRRIIENAVRNDDDVLVYRVHPTYGRYDNVNERSFDAELTAKPGWDPSEWMRAIIEEARGNQQKDVLFSRRLDATEAATNPNARPGVEIYFQDRASMEQMIPILEKFTNNGVDGFTFATDLRLRERQAGGRDVPDYVGIRLQFVPEIRARFDDDFRNAILQDPTAMKRFIDEAMDNMQNAINALDQSGAKIVDARIHQYDSLVVGQESYDQFLRGIANPEDAASSYEGGARSVDPKKRFGQSVQSHVEGRDRALRKGVGDRPADASGAVEQPEPSLKARGGRVGYAKGGAVSSAVREISDRADKSGLTAPQLAHMIRVASGMNMPPERAREFAQQILMHDLYGLTERFNQYSNARRTLMRVNAMIGGESHKNTFKKGGLFQKHKSLEVAKHAAGDLLASGMGHPVMRESMKKMLRMIK